MRKDKSTLLQGVGYLHRQKHNPLEKKMRENKESDKSPNYLLHPRKQLHKYDQINNELKICTRKN